MPKKAKKKAKTKKRPNQSNKKGHWRNKDRQLRSSFEDRVKAGLDGAKADYEYETLKIPYVQHKRYTPDFILANGIVVEVKGLFDTDDRRKHKDVKAQYPDLDIRFLFLRDNKLRKGAKSTYTQWCAKNGFICAMNDLPEEWLVEAPCPKKIKAIKDIKEK